MIFTQRYSLPIMATLAIILSISSITQADRISLTKPTNNTNIFAGCPVVLGFSVQHSGLAVLKTVQLQVLGVDNSVLIDILEYTSRAEWGDTHTKDIPWMVPADWTPGEYIVRVLGNATYPCVQDRHHTRCPLVVEDRQTVHLKPLDTGSQGCPSATKSLVGDNSQVRNSIQFSEDEQQIASNNPTTTDHPQGINDATTNSDNSSSDSDSGSTKSVTSNSTGSEASGTEGSSTQLHLILNQATLELIQDQTILKVLNEMQDYNLVNATVTLLNGKVVRMSDLMDNSTSTRFIQTLETTNATLTGRASTSNSKNNSKNNSTGLHVIGTAELIEALHKNSSLIQAPKSSNSNLSFTLDRNNATTDPSGRQFTQKQEDGDQIQDKSKEASGYISVQVNGQLCAVVVLVLISGSWVI